MRWHSLLLLLLPLPLLPACDPTLDPDPPRIVSSHTEAFSVGYGHVLVVSDERSATPGSLQSFGSAIQTPPVDADADGKTDPLKLPPLVDIAAGRRHACAVTTTGSVQCWGDQTNGALGPQRVCDPPSTPGGAPNCILGPDRGPSLPAVRTLAAGDDVTCATIREGDAVFCWGDRARRGGSTVPVLDPPTPVRLPNGAALSAVRVSARGGAMCALDHDAALWCWGDGFGEQPQRQPQAGVIDLAIGPHHSCLIDASGLACWGDNRNGQVGDFVAAKTCPLNEPCTIDEPYHVDLDATQVVVGERHTCALGRDGKVTCFGSNEIGQLGRDDAFLVGDRGPVMANGFVLDGFTELAGEQSYTCALRGTSRELWCWGSSIGDQP